MKALILQQYNQLEYTDARDPEYGLDDVLIRVHACGICGSDVHGMDGSTGRRVPPLIMGHEASGIVEAAGANVKDITVGDRVTFDSTISCAKCHFCRRGLINLCDNRRVLGVSCDDYHQDGAFAEYVAVPQHIVYGLPDGLTFERAALVEPLSVAVHAVERTPTYLNDNAVVIGAGIIGLLVIQVLRAAGCGRIIAVDVDQARLDLACALGADEGLRPDQCSVPAEVRERTRGYGADVAFEAVGLPATVKTACDCLRKGGLLALVGNVSPTVELPLQSVVTRELTLYGSCASCGEYSICLDLLANGTVDVDRLISATAPLKQGAEWFKRMYDREPGLMKVVLVP
jgi:L-iditol 2-dehydrogenase